MTSYEIPTKVYKYFNKKRESSIADGLFYVNTFSNIRAGENGLINDNTEGITNNASGIIKIKDSNDPEHRTKMDYFEAFGFIVVEDGASAEINIANGSFSHNLDAYMYCVTTERNDSYWKNMPKDQGGPYDRCIEITDFQGFSRQLFDQLKMQEKTLTKICVDKTFLESNQGVIADGIIKYPNFFRKPNNESFKQQKEWRIVMLSSDGNYSPQTVRIPLKYFRFIDI